MCAVWMEAHIDSTRFGLSDPIAEKPSTPQAPDSEPPLILSIREPSHK